MFVQIKAHNERRLGVKWERPVDKLREVILAIRAFWDCWQNGTKLNFRGDFFKPTLMTPFFNPGPHDYPDIPIYIAGVNPRLCQLAGELGQGFLVHPFHSARYLREQILPNIELGLARSGRQRSDIQLSSTIFVIPTDDEQEAARYEADARQQLAFYVSTPSYRRVMALHGWGDTADDLGALAVRRRSSEMPRLITAEMLGIFVVRGAWAELPYKLQQKYGDSLDRLSYYLPYRPGHNDSGWRATIAGFRDS